MAYQTATNPQTGEKVLLVGDQWVPVSESATNERGQKAYLVNNQWLTDQPEAPAKSAGFSLKDTGRTAQQGLYGGLQALTDLFGTGNVVSKDLTELQQEAAGKLSEERKAEIARRELLKKKAEGNTWEEIKATVGGFTEAPFQTSVGALAGSVPIIASAFLPGGQPAAVAGLTGRAALGARALAAAKSPAAGIGALMGVGGQKGQDYQAVKEALLAKNFSEAEAERLAQEVSGYSLENAPRQLASGLMGGLEGATGIEGLLGRAGRLGKALPKVDKAVDMPEPTFGQALRRNILGEALPEAAQAGTGTVGTNIALNQAGIPTDLLQGVAAQVINDALVGGTLGAGFSPLKMREMRQEFVNDEIARKLEEDAKIAEGIKKAAAQRATTKQQLIGDQPLLLAGPSQELEPTKEVLPLQNPIGNLTPDELGPEVTSYINQYRKANSLPRLNTYSIEDVKDAMTAVNPEGERAALDSILAAKTGYTGQQTFTAKDVENAAIEKNVATGTKGFSDFLARTTGVNSLDQMSEPQLYAAFKALTDMPANTTGQQTILPEGTNASRFTQKQYDGAVKYVGLTFNDNNGKPLSIETILSDIKEATNLSTDRDAKALLDTAIKNGDLEQSQQVVYRTFKPDTDQMVATYPTRERAAAAAKKQRLNVREATLTQVAPKAPVTPPTAPRAGLPAGYDITERQFKEGEEPEGYQITSEEGGKPFPTILNQSEVQGKIDQLSTDRREIADQKLQEVLKYEQTVNEGKRELEKLEAAGEFDTDAYKLKRTRQAAKEDLLGKRIEALYKEITSLTAPLKSKAVGSKPIARKGFTVTKEGKESGTFPTREAAEESVLAGLSDAELDALVSEKKFGGLQNRAAAEQNRRRSAPATTGKKVSEVLKDLESGPPIAETPELLAKTKPLRDMLNRFGLGDVALKIVKAIENKADGSYAGKVIELALDAKNPIRTLRHESLHALKELGFFTDAQWKSLEKMARDKWIPKYLEGSTAVLKDGKTGTRLQAYEEMGLSKADIIEEAIADAFGDFDANKAPPGMLTALLNKMRGFFESLNNYLEGRGFQNSQDIFGAIEKGQLKPQTKPQAPTAQTQAAPKPKAPAKQTFVPKLFDNVMPYEETSPPPGSEYAAFSFFNVDGVHFGVVSNGDVEVRVPPELQKYTNGERNIVFRNGDNRGGVYSSDNLPRQLMITSLHDALVQHIESRGDVDGVRNAVESLRQFMESGGKKKLSVPNSWKATPEVTAEADKYFEENGILPYTSEGQMDVPVEVSGKKFSIKGAYTEAQGSERVKKRRDGSEVVVPAKFNDPITGLPMNADGTVTLYYPTTNEIARNIATAKKLTAHSPTANRIYLTNESSSNAVTQTPGMIDQPLGGANVMFKVDPSMIELAQVYDNGRRDFFIPIAEGEVFAKKMKMTKLFTVNAPRDRGLHADRTLSQVTEGIEKATNAWKNANPKERAQMFSDAKDVLREQHNIGTLFGANAKLEKTNIGDYGLLFKGKKVMSTGLGFASAQKINDQSRETTCPKSAICEALCLGETSGQNELYGGEGPYRSGPRLSQYLKTEAFVVNPEAFTTSMIRQIETFRNAARKLGYYPAIRLNVTSDFPPKMYKPVIEMFPDVVFYDYTKLETKPIAENHHLTYSSTGASQELNGNIIYNKESNWDRVVDKILSSGKNVAMAFTSRNDMPKFVQDERTGQTFEVWNGDEYDARFLDPARDDGKGLIIGLTNKDRTTAPEEAASRHNGFFLDYDPQRDGDTLVIKNQKNLAAEFQGKPPEPTPPSTFKGIPVKKMSLREAPDTPAFKQWFGDSKVVDANGKPRVLYHGTDQDISTFRPYIFTTPDPKVADQFPGGEEPVGQNIMPVYVRAENPFNYNNPSHINRLKSKIDDAELIQDIADGYWQSIESPDVLEAMQALGFDSFYVSELGAKNIAVFKPEQIKSATGNIGTFDATNPDIRYSLREAPDTPEFKQFFKRSGFINSSGQPMTMYHATDADITEFRTSEDGKLGAGIYLSSVPKYVTQYAPEGNVMPLYVSAQNPFILNIRAESVKSTLASKLPFVNGINQQMEAAVTLLTQGKKRLKDLTGQQVQNLFKRNGYDGILARDDEGNIIEATVFKPEQVKSAIGNVGTYSPKSKDIRYSVRSVEDAIKAMPNGDKIHQAVATKTTAREEKSIARRILDAFAGDSIASLRQQALNRYNQLSVYDKRLADQMGGKELLADSSAEAAALLSDTASGVAAAAFGVNNIGGAPVYRNGVTVVDNFDGEIKGLMDILMPLAELKDPFAYRAWQFYAGSKRGSRFEADGREKLFDKDDFAYAAQLETEYPMFKQVYTDWMAYNDKLVDYMVSTGIISKGKAAEFTKYADYIPFYRQLEGEDTIGPKVFQSISGVKAPKKLKGDSDAPLGDFLETMVRNTQSIIQAGMKNTAGQKAVDVALALNDAQKLDKQSNAPGTITIMRDGEYVSYAVADELFINSVKSLNMPDVKLWGIFAGPANLLRNMVTKDPGFMLANLLRDSMSAYVTSGVKMTPVIDTMVNFGRAIGGTDPTYQALVKAGILGGYDYAQGVERSGSMLAADLRKRTGNQSLSEKALDGFGLWSTLEKGTSASDAATRMAVYNRVLEDTGNEAEAIFRALEVMNFNRKGSNPMVRLLTAAIPFLNARMQGLDVFYRAGIRPFLEESPTDRAKAVQKAFFVRGMYLTSLSIAYWAMTHDDDEYKAQEQETRDNNWLIPSLGVKIPIPFEVGVLFKVIPERIMGYTLGDDTGKDFAKSMGRAAWSTFGFLPVPQTALPLLEAVTNYSFYTGRNIVGSGMEGVSPEFQKGPSTSSVASFLGGQLGVSPMKVDHMIKGYTGTIGTYMVDLMDSIGDLNSESPKAARRFEQMPVLKRFAVDPEAKGTVTAYYELKNAVDETVRTINLLERTGKADDFSAYAQENAKLFASRQYISIMEKQMKTLREAASQINNSSMTANEKRESLSAVNQAQINMTRHIQSVKKILAE